MFYPGETTFEPCHAMATDGCGSLLELSVGGLLSMVVFVFVCFPMKTPLLLVWGTPCEPPSVGIGKTRARHRCLEGSQNDVFYLWAITFQPPRGARKCVLVFYEIVLLSVWLASGATFAFPRC